MKIKQSCDFYGNLTGNVPIPAILPMNFWKILNLGVECPSPITVQNLKPPDAIGVEKNPFHFEKSDLKKSKKTRRFFWAFRL